MPCGGSGEKGCTVCDFFVLAKGVLVFLIEFTLALAVLFIVYGAFVIMLSSGNPEKAKEGRTMITRAVTGVAIALAAWLIIGTIMNVLGGGSPLPWNQINC